MIMVAGAVVTSSVMPLEMVDPCANAEDLGPFDREDCSAEVVDPAEWKRLRDRSPLGQLRAANDVGRRPGAGDVRGISGPLVGERSRAVGGDGEGQRSDPLSRFPWRPGRN